MSKQQDSLFRHALSLHEPSASAQTLQQALALYERAATVANLTFPIAFNAAAVCHSLAHLVPEQAHFYHDAAASHLHNALTLLPHNLEALIAAAAVEDSRARASRSPLQILTHRKQAVEFLKAGRHAQPSDPAVRILLAEALILQAEAANEAQDPNPTAPLHEAEAPLNEATWLLDARIADLTRMPTDPTSLAAARHQKAQSHSLRAKLALATARLTTLPPDRKLSALRAAHTALLHVAQDAQQEEGAPAEALLLRAELMQALAEQGAASIDEALVVCRDALRAVDMVRHGGDELGVQVCALLGDLCLDVARGESSNVRVGTLVDEGTRLGYECAVRVAERGGLRVEGEMLYNMGCLIAIGMQKGCRLVYGERELAQILKKAVEAGGITASDLRTDADLECVRSRQWFERLVEYAQAQSQR